MNDTILFLLGVLVGTASGILWGYLITTRAMDKVTKPRKKPLWTLKPPPAPVDSAEGNTAK